MTLMIYTERNHIIPMRSLQKVQTTRPRRKNPIKVGGLLQCYFASRMKKYTCFNCISEKCLVQPFSDNLYKDSIANRAYIKETGCHDPWTNFFGEAIVTEIVHSWNPQNWLGDTEEEYYILTFDDILDEEPDWLEQWAVKDGFPQGFKQADEWFTRKYGVDWKKNEMDIFYFEPQWKFIDYL